MCWRCCSVFLQLTVVLPVTKLLTLYFREWREKNLISEDDAEDTLTYYEKITFIFKPEKPGGLTGNELVTIPHPLLVVCYEIGRYKLVLCISIPRQYLFGFHENNPLSWPS